MFILDLNFIYSVLEAFDLVVAAYDCTLTHTHANKQNSLQAQTLE